MSTPSINNLKLALATTLHKNSILTVSRDQIEATKKLADHVAALVKERGASYFEALLEDSPSFADLQEHYITLGDGTPLCSAIRAGQLLECWANRDKVESHAGPNMIHGIYDHFKGGTYQSFDVGIWASGEGEYVVEYVSLDYTKKYYRFCDQWNELVLWPDGKYRSRFVYRGKPHTYEGDTPPPYKVPLPKEQE